MFFLSEKESLIKVIMVLVIRLSGSSLTSKIIANTVKFSVKSIFLRKGFSLFLF